MRLLTRRLYRAFPELDAYTDLQCERFMRSARRGRRLWFGAVSVAVVMVGLIFAVVLGDMLGEISNEYQHEQRRDILWVNVLTYLAFCPLIAAPFGVALLVRDWMMRRRVRVILREESACPRCKYRLLGLALESNSTIKCPECGLVSEVDPSLSELVLDEAGKQQLRPVIVLPPPPPVWKRRGVRMTVRIAAVLILAPIIVWVSFFGWLSHQVSAARAAVFDRTAKLSAIAGFHQWPEAATQPDSVDELTELLTASGVIDHDISRTSTNPMWWGGQGGPLDAVLRNDGSAAQGLMITLAGEYRKHGVFERLRSFQGAARVDLHGAKTVRMYAPFLMPQPPWSGTGGFLAEINGVRMELARRRGDWVDFNDAFESNLALARLLKHQDHASHLVTACEIERKTFDRLRAVLSNGIDQARLDAARNAITRQRTELPPALVFECDRLASHLFVATQYQEVMRDDITGFDTLRELWDARSAGVRLGSVAENCEALDDFYKHFETLAAEEPHARGPVMLQQPTNLGLVRFCFPEHRYEAIEAFDRNLLERRSIDVQLALEQCRLTRGSYPGSLEELVPEFLTTLPLDPWSGRPLCYKRTDPAADIKGRPYLLYSTGFDGTDDGGMPMPGGDQSDLLKLTRYAAPGSDYIINLAPRPAGVSEPPGEETAR